MSDKQDKLTPADEQKLADLKAQADKQSANKSDAKASPNSPAKVDSTPYVNPQSDAQNSPPKSSSNTSAKTESKSSKQRPKTPTSTSNTQTKSAKNTGLWILSLFNFLLILAALGAAYWLWMQWQDQLAQQNNQLSQQQTKAAQQQSAIASSLNQTSQFKGQIEQQSAALETSIQSLISELQAIHEQVKVNQQNLADVSGRRPSDWLLAEADYLVRMAGRKLWLEKDLSTAREMLFAADQRLQELDDPSLLPIRETLANDIQSVQQVNSVSTDAIALRLGAMLGQVEQLPLAFFKKPESSLSAAPSPDENTWQANLARNWQQVTENFFSVKRKTADIQPFMSAQEQWLAREQLSFSLLQAQVAVLKQNQPLFKQALALAQQHLAEHFEGEHPSTLQFSADIRELISTHISQTYPSQLFAAPLLEDALDTRINQRFSQEEAIND